MFAEGILCGIFAVEHSAADCGKIPEYQEKSGGRIADD